MKYIVFIFVYILPQLFIYSYAQSPAQEREYTRQREAASQKSANNASLNQNSYNNRPFENKRFETNSGTTNSSYSKPEKKFITYEEQVRRGEAERRQWKEEELKRKNAENLALEKTNKLEANKIAFINAYKEKNPIPALPLGDQHEFLELAHYTSLTGDKMPDRSPQALAYKNFKKESATGNFNTLFNYVVTMQLTPGAAMECIGTLYRRFPDQKSYLQENELLLIMPFIFGGNIREMLWPHDYYAWSTYDVADNTERDLLIDRFDLLSNLYPKIALEAAGRCRIGQNPYKLLADRTKLQSIDVRSDYFFKVVTSVYKTPESYKGFYESYADRRMRRAGEWLNYYAKKKMNDLSVADWQAIANAQDLPLESVAWAFRNANDEEGYLTKYKNLHKAMKQK